MHVASTCRVKEGLRGGVGTFAFECFSDSERFGSLLFKTNCEVNLAVSQVYLGVASEIKIVVRSIQSCKNQVHETGFPNF